MSEFKFVAMKHVDQTAVQVDVMEKDNLGRCELCGTLMFTPEGWKDFKEQVLRTKVKTEG